MPDDKLRDALQALPQPWPGTVLIKHVLATVEPEMEQMRRGGKTLGETLVFLADLIKDAYLRGADDPIAALNMLGNYLAEVFEGEGGLPADDYNRVYRALEERREVTAALKQQLAAVQKIHRRSMFPATNGEDRGKHFCPACTYSVDGWTAYAVWPCATAAALEGGEGR